MTSISSRYAAGSVQLMQPCVVGPYDMNVDRGMASYRNGYPKAAAPIATQPSSSSTGTHLRPSSRGRLPDFPAQSAPQSSRRDDGRAGPASSSARGTGLLGGYAATGSGGMMLSMPSQHDGRATSTTRVAHRSSSSNGGVPSTSRVGTGAQRLAAASSILAEMEARSASNSQASGSGRAAGALSSGAARAPGRRASPVGGTASGAEFAEPPEPSPRRSGSVGVQRSTSGQSQYAAPPPAASLGGTSQSRHPSTGRAGDSLRGASPAAAAPPNGAARYASADRPARAASPATNTAGFSRPAVATPPQNYVAAPALHQQQYNSASAFAPQPGGLEQLRQPSVLRQQPPTSRGPAAPLTAREYAAPTQPPSAAAGYSQPLPSYSQPPPSTSRSPAPLAAAVVPTAQLYYTSQASAAAPCSAYSSAFSSTAPLYSGSGTAAQYERQYSSTNGYGGGSSSSLSGHSPYAAGDSLPSQQSSGYQYTPQPSIYSAAVPADYSQQQQYTAPQQQHFSSTPAPRPPSSNGSAPAPQRLAASSSQQLREVQAAAALAPSSAVPLPAAYSTSGERSQRQQHRVDSASSSSSLGSSAAAAAAVTPRAYPSDLSATASSQSSANGTASAAAPVPSTTGTSLASGTGAASGGWQREPKQGLGCVGLQNCGNTCYMNSVLQSLNAVPELVGFFQRAAKDGGWGAKAVVAPAYADLVAQVWGSPYQSVVSPSAFGRKVSRQDSRWGDGSQQDAQEFLHSLLGALQSECNRVTAKPVYKQLEGKGTEEQQADEAADYARVWHDSVVDDVFGGLLQSTITCHVCRKQSHCFDPFQDLAVPIPQPTSTGGTVSIQDCLKAFTELEKLEGSNSYKCETCKKCVAHSKRLQVYHAPKILVLTLKRFSAKASSGGLFSRFRSASKNTTPVALEVDRLDLSSFCNPLGNKGGASGGRKRGGGGGAEAAPLYQLIAVSHHSGGLEGGHYTAQARSCNDGLWYNFNDSSVRKDSKPGGPSSSAYVLIYRQVDDASSL